MRALSYFRHDLRLNMTMGTLRNSIGLMALSTLLMAITCKKAPGTPSLQTLAEGRWVLTELEGRAITLPDGAEAPYLQLDSTGTQISGHGGCNHLMGEMKLDGDKLSFPMVGGTKRYCESTMALENGFTKALRSTSGYRLKGKELTLTGGGQELAKLEQRR